MLILLLLCHCCCYFCWHFLLLHVQTLSALQLAHSALSRVFSSQAALYLTRDKDDRQPLPPTLLDDHVYRQLYEVITSELCQKGERDTTVDPQRNTIKDTYDADELRDIVDCLLTKGTAETDRALAMALWSHSSVGRSDDVRLFYLADLITPQYIPTVGEYCTSDGVVVATCLTAQSALCLQVSNVHTWDAGCHGCCTTQL